MNHTFVTRKIQGRPTEIVLPDMEWIVKLQSEAEAETSGGFFQSVYNWFCQYRWLTISQFQRINQCFKERGIAIRNL